MAKAVAKKQETSIIPGDLYKDAGQGGQTATSDDMTIPFIKVAQALSDEINKREGAYIEGLEQGDFFNSATEQIWNGDKGFYFMPCCFKRQNLEWIPRSQGGGFVSERPESIMDETTLDDMFNNVLPNGNEIVVTATWFGLVVEPETGAGSEAVLSLSKTQLKKSRMLMTKLKSLRVKGGPDGTFNPALRYNMVHITSVPESNDKGNWFGWHLNLSGSVFDIPNGKALYARGKTLMEAVEVGAAKAAVDQPVGEEVPF